jgi:hypothetical protein
MNPHLSNILRAVYDSNNLVIYSNMRVRNDIIHCLGVMVVNSVICFYIQR